MRDGFASLSREAPYGAFTTKGAEGFGVSRRQLDGLLAADVIERRLPNTFVVTAVPGGPMQDLAVALLWAGPKAAGRARSSAAAYGIEVPATSKAQVALPHGSRRRHADVDTRIATRPLALMPRTVRGTRVSGPEATLVQLAAQEDAPTLELACEDARRRKITTIPALEAYLTRFGARGMQGVGPLRALLRELDPSQPARSPLETHTRRLLVAHGLTDFVRERPLAWNGKTYYFDFCFERGKTILETNGFAWHGDVADFQSDQEKWSVPGRYGYRLVLATWDDIRKRPEAFIADLRQTLAARA